MLRYRAAVQVLGILLGSTAPAMAQEVAPRVQVAPVFVARADFRPAPPVLAPVAGSVARPVPSILRLETAPKPFDFAARIISAQTFSPEQALFSGEPKLQRVKNGHTEQAEVRVLELAPQWQIFAFHRKLRADALYPGAALPSGGRTRDALLLVNQAPQSSKSLGLSLSFRFGRP